MITFLLTLLLGTMLVGIPILLCIALIGFIGIAVALLGRNTAVGVALSALLFGALLNGTSTRNLDPEVFQPELAGNLTLMIQALVLLFVVWQVWWTDVESDRAHAATVTSLEREFAQASRDVGSDSGAASAQIKGDVFAVVRIPRFGADYARPLVEGLKNPTVARDTRIRELVPFEPTPFDAAAREAFEPDRS